MAPSGRSRGPRGAGSDTRAAIAAAAREQFAELGYERASLRGIAEAAGVDPRLITHYFGSKQALFVSVVDLPFDPEAVFGPLLAGGDEGVGARLAGLVVGTLADPAASEVLTALVRAAASEQLAADLVRQAITERLLLPLARAIGRPNAELRAALAASQIVGLTMARHVVGVRPLADLPDQDLAAALAPVLQHYLTGPLPGDSASSA